MSELERVLDSAGLGLFGHHGVYCLGWLLELSNRSKV
jgi:hypothetical protein